MQSIADQKVLPDEIILVDNGSTDRSWEIMTEWAKERANVNLLSEPRRGACAARNTGLKEVRTDFVEFFDSDDIMLPHHIEDFEQAIYRHPDVDIFGRDIYLQDVTGSRRRLYFSARNPMFNHIFRSSLSTGRIVVRTSLVREVGGWDESLNGWDDYELGVRLLLRSVKLRKLKGTPSVIALRHEDSMSGLKYSSHHEHWENALAQVRNNIVKSGRLELIKWIDARCMILASQYMIEAKSESVPEAKQLCVSLSLNLRKAVLTRTPQPLRMNLLYYHNIHFHRLTWILAKLIFQSD